MEHIKSFNDLIIEMLYYTELEGEEDMRRALTDMLEMYRFYDNKTTEKDIQDFKDKIEMTKEEAIELLSNVEVKNPLAIIKKIRELGPRELSEIKDLHNKDYLLEENK